MAGVFMVLAGLLGLVAVILGAWSAHGLTAILSPRFLESMQTAVQYQFFHVLALFGVALALRIQPGHKLLIASSWCFVIGMLGFCGSIYGLVLLDMRALGPVTPMGGMILMLGWLLLMLAGLRWGKTGQADR